MALLLGIDCGSSAVKAAVYDSSGVQVAGTSVHLPHQSPRPRWVERDVDSLWSRTASAIATVLERVDATKIVAVGVTGHGDGVYLVDEQGLAVRKGILSLDSRAHEVIRDWSVTGVLERALSLTGQVPFAAAPAPVLKWLLAEEPMVLSASRWALACKDVVKLRLTGQVAADPTEASTSFCDVRTQQYSAEALELFGLAGQAHLLAPVVGSCDVIGPVNDAASRVTGLPVGTPVVSGLHDVDACALGSGGAVAGTVSVVAGTYSINQIVARAPQVDERWCTRNFVRPGEWMHMAVSPTSATNFDWLVRKVCADVVGAAQPPGTDPYTSLIAQASDLPPDVQLPLFLPFLYGSPLGAGPSGAFLGLRGWHERPHLAAAVLEGVVHSHRWHVSDLASVFEVGEVRLTGGASQSDLWTQMFADGLELPVVRTREAEAGSLGAAMVAGVGVGQYSTLEQAVDSAVVLADVKQPDDDRVRHSRERYETFRLAVDALTPLWSRMSA